MSMFNNIIPVSIALHVCCLESARYISFHRDFFFIYLHLEIFIVLCFANKKHDKKQPDLIMKSMEENTYIGSCTYVAPSDDRLTTQ